MRKLLLSVFLSINLLCFSGCERPPMRKWVVNIIRPDGTIQKKLIINSQKEPKINTLWGGQTELLSVTKVFDNYFYKPTGIVAPTGWFLEYELVE
jgi:hypothetical protein